MTFTRFRIAMWAVLLTAVFALLVASIPKVELLTILNGIFLGIVVAALIVYAPLVYMTFGKKQLDRVSQLSLGIGLLFLSIAMQRLYWIIWHIHGMPKTWQSNWVLAGVSFISIVGGCLFVTAPGYPPAASLEPVLLWGNNRRLLFFLGALGGVVTFALSVYTGNAF